MGLICIPAPWKPLSFSGANLQATYPMTRLIGSSVLNIAFARYDDSLKVRLTGALGGLLYLQRLEVDKAKVLGKLEAFSPAKEGEEKMNKFAETVLSRGLAANQRLTKTAANGFDWLFRRDTMIQSGRTWFELVYDSDAMAVRYYDLVDEDDIELADGSRMPVQKKKHDVPLVIVPPLAVITDSFDLMPQLSLVRYMAAAGYKTYLVDWSPPERRHADFDLRSYSLDMLSTALEKVRLHSGSEDLSMMGWCLGGLLCLMYQGQTQDPHIRNTITVASPIDVSAGGPLAAVYQALNAPARLVRNYTNFRLHSLNPARSFIPGWANALTFKSLDPIGSVTTYWDLLAGLSDRKFVEKYTTTSDYLNNMTAYPGGVIQDMAVHLLVDNKLADGRVELRDSVVELDKVQSALLSFAGETDTLVPPEIAEKVIDIVGSKDKTYQVAPGGHMGVFLGSKAQKVVWKESVDWLAPRSKA